MLVVISDLHFEEEALDRVCQGSSPVHLPFVRNLDPEAFHLIIARLAAEVERNQAHRLDVVLAGDVFDLHRTMLWFGTCAADGSDVADANPQRPYVAIQHVTPALEAKVLAILDAINLCRTDLDIREHNVVCEMRSDGTSWATIGALFGITRQAAQQRFGS